MAFTKENKENEISEQRRSPVTLRRYWWVILLAIFFLCGASVILVKVLAPAAKQKPNPSTQKVTVVTAAARKSDFGVYITGLGTVTPLHTVTVKSRVDGELMRVLFREGQMVKNGELLAEIDPRPYEAQLTQAEGQMVRDQALLANARIDLERYKVLWAQDSIPQQQLATQEALVRQYEGTVENDQGLVDNAKVQVLYCHITSPINGRVGLRLVDPGNIIHATDTTGLLVITQMQPMDVIFPIPEDSLPSVLAKLKAGQPIPVDAYDRAQSSRLATGSLLTIDNQVDTTTGTVRFKAEFPNEGNELFPNQFVNARLLLDVKRGAVIVPAAAIQTSPQGPFVYVIKSDKTASLRMVKKGVTEGDETSIDGGISPGELVVIDGADRLKNGSRVELQETKSVPSVRARQ
jgi:multidrug efflux system membrane fusion protein